MSNVKLKLLAAMMAALVLPVECVYAQEIKPETVTAVQSIPDGPKLYVHGMGKVSVIDPESLKFMGLISTATAAGVWWGQYYISNDGKTAYVSKTYYDHGVSGTRSDTIQEWDIKTLEPKREAELSVVKQAMRGADRALMSMSSDGRFIYLQNATPATSFTVFDVASQKTASEVPLPGCWGVYPVDGVAKVAALCGDGRISTVSLDDAGKSTGIERSDKIFDVDSDPLFTDYQRDGNILYMISFAGNLYKIDISGRTAKLVEKTSIVAGVDGGWLPSSNQPLAYVKEAGIIYVLMRGKSDFDQHDKEAQEVWAYDLKHKKVVSRSTVDEVSEIVYYGGKQPMLFMSKRDGVLRYAVDPASNYAARKDKFIRLDGASALKVHQ